MDLIPALEWRYAVKQFDPTKKVSDADIEQLLDAMVLSPSSYGLQPWKFIVITNQELKEQLRPHSWNQSQITDCSHLIVFTHKKNITEGDVQTFIDRTASTRNMENKSMLDGYKDLMIQNVVHGKGESSADTPNWTKQQTYIALGQAMVAAAAMGIDTCPVEGFSPAAYDEILGLENSEYTTAVVLPVGYRSEKDKYATLAKVRYTKDELIDRR